MNLRPYRNSGFRIPKPFLTIHEFVFFLDASLSLRFLASRVKSSVQVHSKGLTHV